jgi:acetyl esterase/lipase
MIRANWSRRCLATISVLGLIVASVMIGGGPPQSFAEGPAAGPVIPLWPQGAPGAKGTDPDRDVPTLTTWLPPVGKATGASIVVCPGGGYGMLAVDHEGKQVAEWLNQLGVAAFVLKYRLGPRYHHPAMLQDASRAIRTVRARASEWGLDPHKIAILGFSAGGHLASTAGTHFDSGKPEAEDPIERVSSRPDRMILVYPVIALATPFGHTGSLRNLLGDNPSQELIESLSNERQVTKDTPPTFLAHTNADTGVPAENSLLFAMALRKAAVPVEMHLFERGPHGLGLGVGAAIGKFRIPPDPAFQAWPKLCATWLKNQGFLARPSSGR